ncbi:hypothetical protein SKAU_G00069530 [Synaphobranchus kaupii]|uniref:Uncharacterized protein n=1 Tax=Synaphobranchus kaupii TaxID=118154 RepID=A0A9Q1G6F5_SYNKA|nr:hypothetical protein SKAU_G00069530 [Synaphobranchus kaupii]
MSQTSERLAAAILLQGSGRTQSAAALLRNRSGKENREEIKRGSTSRGSDLQNWSAARIQRRLTRVPSSEPASHQSRASYARNDYSANTSDAGKRYS